MTATMYPRSPKHRRWGRRAVRPELPAIDRTIPLFAHLSRRHLGRVDGLYDVVTVPSDHFLTNVGHTGREFIVILDGSAEVESNGGQVRMLGAGDHLGEISLLRRSRHADTRRTATVRTTSTTVFATFTARNFARLIERCPTLVPTLERDGRGHLARDVDEAA